MKKYPISDDIALLHDKFIAAKKIRDLAIKLPWGYKKALRAAIDRVYFEKLFWKKIREVYSEEFKGKTIEYYPIEQEVGIKEPE
jgi:hypothetical protein